MKVKVAYSPIAVAQLSELKAARDGSAQASVYKALVHIITNILAESDLAFLPQHHLSKDLAGVMRVKKGRMRLFFIGSKDKGAVTVLMLGSGSRKEGDRNDPYVEIKRFLRRDVFDECFRELGLTKPKV